MENQILIALKNNKLLKNILFTELDLSNIKGNLLTLSEGEILYREGDVSEYLYLIVSGEMNVIRKKGSRRTLSEIFTDYDFFGSDEFIETSERKSTAVALRDSYIIALTKVEIDSLIEQDDEILTNLYESLHQEEPEAEINTPDLEKVNFKSISKQESNFADRVKKQEESEDYDSESEETEEGVSDGDETRIDNTTEDSEIKKPEQKKAEDPFVNAYSENLRSFNKVEPKKEPEQKKSFKDKIESTKKKETVPEEDQPNKAGEDFAINDEVDSAQDAAIPDHEISPEPGSSSTEGKQEKFPTTFEVSFSYSDGEKQEPSTDNDATADVTNSFENTGEDSISTDNFTDSIDESYTPESEIGSAGRFEEVKPEDLSEPEETLPPATEDSRDLEDFYSSISESVNSNETPNEVDSQSGDVPQNDNPLAGLDDYNPFPESDNSTVQEDRPHEFTIGEEYKPEEESEDSVIPDDIKSIKTEEADDQDLINSIDEAFSNIPVPEDTEPEDVTSSDELLQEEPLQESHKEPEPDAPVTDSPITSRDYEEIEQSIDILNKINKAAQVVNSNIQIDDVFKGIVDVATDLTHADRGTLYLVDKKKNELWSKVAIGNEFKEIKLSMGEGIAGWAAQKGEVINLENVKDDPRFNSSFDKTSGYETKTMICFPIKNKNEDIVGVLQLINSHNGKFSKLDEEFLEALSIHAAMALQNAELVEQLLTGERVSSLGKMANFLLQDIKKPIMVSKRYAEHLKSKVLEEDVSRVVDMLLDQLNHIADLVQSTSSYSEGQIVLRSMLCKLNETLDDYISRVDAILRSSNCQIQKEFDNEINVKIAPKQMYQCFQHIIKNACDAMPDGGTIYLSTKVDKENVHIIVKDNGLGIPESLHEKIFEPFMSHGKKEGTGLGLSITKKIIEEHGGSISVQSEMGEGATFTITLPVVFSM